jgi:hypothetical protein
VNSSSSSSSCRVVIVFSTSELPSSSTTIRRRAAARREGRSGDAADIVTRNCQSSRRRRSSCPYRLNSGQMLVMMLLDLMFDVAMFTGCLFRPVAPGTSVGNLGKARPSATARERRPNMWTF